MGSRSKARDQSESSQKVTQPASFNEELKELENLEIYYYL
jgi:hypothetical protein